MSPSHLTDANRPHGLRTHPLRPPTRLCELGGKLRLGPRRPNQAHRSPPGATALPSGVSDRRRSARQLGAADKHRPRWLIFKTSFHIFLIKQLIQIQNQLHKSNIIQCWQLQGSPARGWGRVAVPEGGPCALEPRFCERLIGFHGPLRGNPLNAFAIISLITLPALGHSLDLTEIRN